MEYIKILHSTLYSRLDVPFSASERPSLGSETLGFSAAGVVLMTKGPKLSPPSQALEKTEKGSHRSMWELLLQLRVLLPYLSHLLPLLDRGLKSAPDFSEFTQAMAAIETGTRDLEAQARNQALQLERIEQQIGRLRVVHENSIEESRRFYTEFQYLRRLLMGMSIVMCVLLLATITMATLVLMRS